MTALEDVPDIVYKAIVFGVAIYFMFLILGLLTGSAEFILGSEIYFGLLAVGIGALLFARAANKTPLIMGSATILVLGGVAQFFYIATRDELYSFLATVFVFIGIFGYIFVVVRTD